jgi:hypothetical protein
MKCPFRARTVFKDDHLASMVDAVLEEEEEQKKQTVRTSQSHAVTKSRRHVSRRYVSRRHAYTRVGICRSTRTHRKCCVLLCAVLPCAALCCAVLCCPILCGFVSCEGTSGHWAEAHKVRNGGEESCGQDERQITGELKRKENDVYFDRIIFRV